MKHGRSINCVFCDDVRHEIGNKVSLIGIYGGEMLIQTSALPVLLPKLGVHVFINTPIKKPFKRATVWIVTPSNQEVARVNVEDIKMADIKEDVQKVTFGASMVIPLVQITENGAINAWGEIDGERERVGKLLVRIEEQPVDGSA